MKKINKKFNKGGYAILYTVVIISIIMTIAIGLSNSVTKELVLSSVAKDSREAFYQADTAIECGLYLQFKVGSYTTGTPFSCGLDENGDEIDFTITETSLGSSIFNIKPNISSGPCFELYSDTSNNTSGNRLLRASGYSDCRTTNQRRVERTFEVRY